MHPIAPQTPMEYFRAAFTRSLQRVQVSVSAHTEYYVVNLLVAQVPVGQSHDPRETLADRYAAAVQSERTARFRLLRDVGDRALVSCGLWNQREIAYRKPLDQRYAAHLGCRAYSHLGSMPDQLGRFAPDVFSELAYRFRDLADALSQLSIDTSLATARDVVRWYMLWETTKSPQAARALGELGLIPGSGRRTTPS